MGLFFVDRELEQAQPEAGNAGHPHCQSNTLGTAAEYVPPAAVPIEGLSIVIPTLNERGNIEPLSARITDALQPSGIRYELIFVDDHSTDGTRDEITALPSEHRWQLFMKAGDKGKAQSLIEGFARARYDLLAMIDADLQYPPEALPALVDWIRAG